MNKNASLNGQLDILFTPLAGWPYGIDKETNSESIPGSELSEMFVDSKWNFCDAF